MTLLLVGLPALEMVMTYKYFNSFSFIGLRAYKVVISIEETDIKMPIEPIILMKEGKFFFKGLQVYFVSRLQWNPFHLKSFVPFKSVGTVKNDFQIEIVSRIPISPVVACLVLPIVAYNSVGLELSVMVSAVIIISFVINFQLAKSRLKIMIGELKGLVI